MKEFRTATIYDNPAGLQNRSDSMKSKKPQLIMKYLAEALFYFRNILLMTAAIMAAVAIAAASFLVVMMMTFNITVLL